GFTYEASNCVPNSAEIRSRQKGTLVVAPGNRMKLTAETTVESRPPSVREQYVSDGKNFAYSFSPPGQTQWANTTRAPTKNDRYKDTLSTSGFHVGLLNTVRNAVNEGPAERAHRCTEVSGFETVGKEKVGGRPATVIGFALTCNRDTYRHRLWLDDETN